MANRSHPDPSQDPMAFSRSSTPLRPVGSVLRRCTQSRGVVLIITLLAVILLAGLVLYVFNLGHKTSARVAAQNEVDSAANAGAAWVARSLNTVAMNNVAMTRLISNVAVLDAMPMAVAFTYREQLDAHRSADPQGLSQAVQGHLSRGVQDWWARDKLQEMTDRIGRLDQRRQGEAEDRGQELAILGSFDDLFNAPHGEVAPMTFYNAPAGRGSLWQAIESLDELNQITMENLGVMAQLNAVRGAQINVASGDRATAMLLPILPEVPWRRGTFADFQRPVRQGLLPQDTDDRTTNRGPYDTVFGWRDPRGGRVTGHAEQTSIVGGGQSRVPIGRGADGDFVVTGRENPTAYAVHGPYLRAHRQANRFRRQHLPFSRFDHWLRRIADIKLDYAFGQSTPRTIVYPDWRISYDEARQIAQEDASRIVETAFIVVEIKSRYPLDERTPTAQTMQGPDKHWQYVTRRRPSVPWVTRRDGWMDPQSWQITPLGQGAWREEWSYDVNFDRDLGMEPIHDANGQIVPQRVYRVDHYFFAGVNVGQPVEVRNPFNFPSRQNLPAPTELDLASLGPDNTAARQAHLNYLAIVRHHEKPSLWPRLFAGRGPGQGSVAIAQAEVFNDHSWDLWTQMWRSQLKAIDTQPDGQSSDFSQWVQLLEEQQPLTAFIPDLSQEDAQAFLEYLRSVEPLAPAMLSH